MRVREKLFKALRLSIFPGQLDRIVHTVLSVGQVAILPVFHRVVHYCTTWNYVRISPNKPVLLCSLWHLRRMPSLLEYMSYNYNFMGMLAGPTCSYNEYIAFIKGTSYLPRHQENANGVENGKCKQSEPSPKVRHSFQHFNIQRKHCIWSANIVVKFTYLLRCDEQQ